MKLNKKTKNLYAIYAKWKPALSLVKLKVAHHLRMDKALREKAAWLKTGFHQVTGVA